MKFSIPARSFFFIVTISSSVQAAHSSFAFLQKDVKCPIDNSTILLNDTAGNALRRQMACYHACDALESCHYFSFDYTKRECLGCTEEAVLAPQAGFYTYELRETLLSIITNEDNSGYAFKESEVKCPINDPTRLFRTPNDSPVTFHSCYKLCDAFKSCRYFSYGFNSSQWNGVCIGCTEDAIVEPQAGFYTYELTETVITTQGGSPEYAIKENDAKCPINDPSRLFRTPNGIPETIESCARLCDAFESCRYFSLGNNTSGFEGVCIGCTVDAILEPQVGFYTYQLTNTGFNGDPIILGLKDQVFKFEGRDGGWYSNLASRNLQWNMQFRQYDSCPEDENMFVAGMSILVYNDKIKGLDSSILITTTPEPIPACVVDPDSVCLGEGTLHFSFDGGKTFVSQPGDYHFASQSRIVAHNTYAACSRKWHDYDVSNSGGKKTLRDGGRRATTIEEKPIALLANNKAKMISPSECVAWINNRVSSDDLFQQKGHWSTIYVETPQVSFHIEYRRSNSYNPQCDFQSLDAWMTKVLDRVENTEWNGILGETRNKVYDFTGAQIKSDRSLILRGKEDSDYEVGGPFQTEFAASQQKRTTFNKIAESIDTF